MSAAYGADAFQRIALQLHGRGLLRNPRAGLLNFGRFQRQFRRQFGELLQYTAATPQTKPEGLPAKPHPVVEMFWRLPGDVFKRRASQSLFEEKGTVAGAPSDQGAQGGPC